MDYKKCNNHQFCSNKSSLNSQWTLVLICMESPNSHQTYSTLSVDSREASYHSWKSQFSKIKIATHGGSGSHNTSPYTITSPQIGFTYSLYIFLTVFHGTNALHDCWNLCKKNEKRG